MAPFSDGSTEPMLFGQLEILLASDHRWMGKECEGDGVNSGKGGVDKESHNQHLPIQRCPLPPHSVSCLLLSFLCWLLIVRLMYGIWIFGHIMHIFHIHTHTQTHTDIIIISLSSSTQNDYHYSAMYKGHIIYLIL